MRQHIDRFMKKQTDSSTGTPSKLYQKMPSFSSRRKYIEGLSTNWASFYSPIKVSGLKLRYQAPFFDDSMLAEFKIFGMPIAVEDIMIIFKCNDEEYGVSIYSGTNSFTKADLDKDPMLARSLW